MNKKGITKLLREALGVPSNITNLARQVFDGFLNNLRKELPTGRYDFDGYSDVFTMDGDFNISDYSFNKITIKYEFFGSSRVNKTSLASMSFAQQKRFSRADIKVHNQGDFNEVRLTVEMGINIDLFDGNDIINDILADKTEYTSSFAHELKHAYDGYKKTTGSVISSTEYVVFTNTRYRVPTLDKFLHNAYFIHSVENLVRPTEIASEIESGNITKKDFIGFLAANSIYIKLKEINQMTLAGLRDGLENDLNDIIRLFNASNSEIPKDENGHIDVQSLINKTLSLFFLNLRDKKITRLTERLYPEEFLRLFDSSDSKQNKFLDKYENSLRRFSGYEEYYNHELGVFKDVSGKMIKKISKLYAMAKDDENVAEFLNKINNKVTNESVKDWDLYHDKNNTETSTFKDFE